MGFGTTLGLLDVAVTVSDWVSFVAPLLIPARFTIAEGFASLSTTSEIESSVGGSFTAGTINKKLRVPLRLFESVALIVMTALPNWSGKGVNCTVRFEPVPPS